MAERIKYSGNGCPIEHLIFETDDPIKFIKVDHIIWTLKLAQYDGFLSKQIWINPIEPNKIHTIIYWKSMECWNAIPHDELIAQEALFREEMGDTNFRLIDAPNDRNQFYVVQQFTL